MRFDVFGFLPWRRFACFLALVPLSRRSIVMGVVLAFLASSRLLSYWLPFWFNWGLAKSCDRDGVQVRIW